MHFARALILAFVPQLISASDLGARQSVTCDFSIAANNGDTCQTFAAQWGLSVASFQALNPGVVCPNLVGIQSYCIVGTISSATVTSTSSKPTTLTTTLSTTKATTTTSTMLKTTATKATATTSTTQASSAPTQSDTVANCNKYYLVQPGDDCDTIETEFSISASQFQSWNPAIHANCDNLEYGFNICVGVPGAVSSPQPQMPGIVSNCNRYYLVKSGDQCPNIESAAGISQSQFLQWNTQVDAQCDNMWLGYYVCVGASQ